MNDDDEDKLADKVGDFAQALGQKARDEAKLASEIWAHADMIKEHKGAWYADELRDMLFDGLGEGSGSQELTENMGKLSRAINRLLDDEDEGAV